MDDQEIKIILENAKTIAMIGISSEKKKEDPKKINFSWERSLLFATLL